MSLDCTISKSSIVVATQEQLSSDLGGEAIILDMKSGVYYGLNTVGSSIWNLIQEPKTVDEIRDALLAEYEVEPEKCDRDLLALLQEFAAVGLIEVKDEAVA
ncbi:PqqD family peptide modification chaperone [Moorena producens JHB]|uniref:PqqD family peptide modification chaperone n=1 Tax=Moorena producens (strain JHB) TaxID=1454205 RepID=A0A1D9G4C6_MOOP1|nr:PqqD family peptide modification chaperone [Moorena producens]AOY82355.1 PqqD family peptide modification chaperone [Moorena producens JHB]